MSVDVVRLNKTIYSWESCLFKFDNQPMKGILEVDYEQARDVKIVYAALRSGRPLGMTAGKYSVKAFTMKVLRDTADAFTTYLATKGNGSYGDPFWSFIAQVSEPVAGMQPLTASSPFNRIIGKKDAHAEGVDELVTELTIASLWFVENGKTLWSRVRSLDE